MTKITLYPKITKVLKDTDQHDISEDDGVGGFVSKSVDNKFIRGVEVLAFASTNFDATCLPINLGTDGVGVETSLDWNSTGKTVTPTYLRLRHQSGGIKGMSGIKIQIGSTSGGDDILKATTLVGYAVDGNYIVNIMGALPEMLSPNPSVIDTFFFKVLAGADADANESDVFIHGNHTDV